MQTTPNERSQTAEVRSQARALAFLPSSTLPEGEGEPAADETQAAKRGDGAEEAEARRVKHQRVDAAAEHRHTRGEEARRRVVLGRRPRRHQ